MTVNTMSKRRELILVVGMLIVKAKKFGVVWYIPFEMTAKSARGVLRGEKILFAFEI